MAIAHAAQALAISYKTDGPLCCRAWMLMDLIPYSFVPFILFRVPYTVDLLPYYLSIANGAGGVRIFELLVFQCFV